MIPFCMSFYVTTPIYYVNAKPHLGHAYSTIGADIVARHMRQRGEDVFFLTGTDEHGEPVAQVAEREGITPRELADRNVVHFKEMVQAIGATPDFFIRTTDSEHEQLVQEFIQELYDKGEIYEGKYEGWYCPNCADFKSEKELAEGRCPIHKIVLSLEAEDNYFFRLSKYQDALEDLYKKNPNFVMPSHRYNEALSFIEQGLEDISISRSKISWGVPVPWDPSQVIYVWFDALLNYITALKYGTGEDVSGRFWPANLHIMAKDILKFHAVIWPAMLMANGYRLPEKMFIHGYLLMGGEKMSKTRGNVLDPFEVIERYGADALRYYCFREVSFGRDGTISTEGFETRYNTELANELGNLANRSLVMIERYNDGAVPSKPAQWQNSFGKFGEGFQAEFVELFDGVEISVALERAWELVRLLNRYIEEQAPWVLAKDPEAAPQLKTVLYNLADGLRVLATLLYAYMPSTSTALLGALGYSGEMPAIDGATVGLGDGGQKTGQLGPLFPKIETEESR